MHKADDETWKTIPNFGDCYAVSNKGRVKRLKGTSGTRPGRICKPAYLRGYARYRLCVNGEHPRMFNAHRLVYEVFVGPIPEGMQINHKNGVKNDNRVQNLEVVTASENKVHAHEVLGLAYPEPYGSPGEKNPRAKLNWEKVREIRRRYAAGGTSQQALADEFGIDQTNISRLLREDTWVEPRTRKSLK